MSCLEDNQQKLANEYMILTPIKVEAMFDYELKILLNWDNYFDQECNPDHQVNYSRDILVNL